MTRSMGDEDHTRYGGLKHTGRAATSPYPTSRLAPAIDLVDLARQIEESDKVLGTAMNAKLEVIAAQIRALQAQAREVLAEAREDARLHRARCNFQRRIGHIYHLYERPDGETYFSMLAPADWNDAPPHRHIRSYRLEPDMSWTPTEQIDQRGETRLEIEELLEQDGPGQISDAGSGR